MRTNFKSQISNLKEETRFGEPGHRGADLGVLLPGEKVVDLFCGAGGWDAAANRLGISVDFAVNHDEVAIETHRANHPGCVHHQGDAWKAVPAEVVGGGVGAANVVKVGLLLASAACTTHSNARGSAPISPRVHMLGWCIARWMKDVGPRVVMIENVPEWKHWGPLTQMRWKRADKGGGSNFVWEKLDTRGKAVGGPRGRIRGPKARTPAGRAWAAERARRGLSVRAVLVQDPEKKGQHFRRWWRYCESLGYVMEMRVMDAPDFGAACRRKRLFIIARRDGVAITWPEKTHGEVHVESGVGGIRGERGRRAAGVESGAGFLAPFRTAAECIDWSDLGSSIFERTKPLRPKTLARIAEGIRRYVLNDPAPFVFRLTQTGGARGGVGGSVSSVAGCGPTQTTREDLAVAVPVIAPQNTGVFGQRPDTPGPTITTKGHQSLVTPVVAPTIAVCAHGEGAGKTKRWGRGALPVTGPINTVHAGGGSFAVVSAVGVCVPAGGPEGVAGPVDEPYRTVLTRDHCGLAAALLATTGYGEREGQRPRVNPVTGPITTCVDGVKQGLVSPVLEAKGEPTPGPSLREGRVVGVVGAPVLSHFRHGGGQHQRVDEPGATPTSGGNHAALVAALMVEYYGASSKGRGAKEPLGTPTTVDRHGLVCVVISGVEYVIVDILFRMLHPLELAEAMGFPRTYVWPKAKRDATRMIGNAVQVDHAAALIGAVFPGMKAREVAA